MIIKVPYGKEEINIEITDRYLSAIVEPNEVPIGDETETVRDAINNPINSENLHDFLSDSKDILFIVNDATRPTPTARVLEVIYDEIKNFNIEFVVATGIHRAPTEEEYIQIFGRYYNIFKDKISTHDCRAEQDMVYLGKSRNGTEMYVNKLGVDTHKIVIIGSVEPHYFAGYTGGRKSLLPGIASYETIEQNHKLALSPEAKTLALDGNPVHEDMLDALRAIKKEIFSIMTVLDKSHKIYAATAGDITDSFKATINKANDVYLARIKEKVDIVISVVKSPMDINLCQAHKGIQNGKLALKQNGILILVSKCRCGVGGDSFVNLLLSSNSPEEVFKEIEKRYVLGYHIAASIAELSLRAQIWGVTDLPPELLKKIFIRPFNSLQEALNNAIKLKGEDAKVLFLLDGGVTVPVLVNN